MNIVILTNDNYFSHLILEEFLEQRKDDIRLVVFSSALIGRLGTSDSIKWSFKHTGFRHTVFKLMVYGVFRAIRFICNILPFIPNKHSTYIWVKRNEINSICAANINTPEIVSQIRDANPDLIVSVSMNQIVKEDILKMPPKNCINVHCAPLPRYGGMSPYVWILANKEKYSAATIHYMEKGLDEGDIITQDRVNVTEGDSAFALFYRCCLKARKRLPEVVPRIEDGSIESYQQDLSKKTYYSWPTVESVKQLKSNGYNLAKVKDFAKAIFVPEENKKPSVFVTYGWCRSSYIIVRSLGIHGIDVHLGDASVLAMSRFSKHCKSFTKLPNFFIEPDAYFKAVCDALKKTGAKVLLPGHEDVGIFAKYKNDLPENVCLAMPDEENYTPAEDKLTIINLAQEVGINAARTNKITSMLDLEHLAKTISYPTIVKARAGNSAKGVRIAHNKEDLIKQFQELVQDYNLPNDRWPIVQEYLPGEAVGVCLLYNHGKCIASFAEKYLRCKKPNRFGTSTLREPFDNPQLISKAVSILDKLQWHGVAHLDFIADKDGVFKLIEINPRLWGALALSFFAGVDFPYLWYLTALGEDIPEQNLTCQNDIKCRWIAGECLASVEMIKHGRFGNLIKLFIPHRNCYHDDFILTDPMPFMFEIFDYFVKFVKAGGSTNPVTKNMIR